MSVPPFHQDVLLIGRVFFECHFEKKPGPWCFLKNACLKAFFIFFFFSFCFCPLLPSFFHFVHRSKSSHFLLFFPSVSIPPSMIRFRFLFFSFFLSYSVFICFFSQMDRQKKTNRQTDRLPLRDKDVQVDFKEIDFFRLEKKSLLPS